MAETRLKRLCDVCGQYDDAPRHVTAVTEGGTPSDEFIDGLADEVSPRAIREVLDPTTTVRHMDCCAEAGCSVCSNVMERAGSKRNGALVKFLTQEG